MGIVVRFKARRHGRASAGSRLAILRAANSTKRSAVTPPALPVSESTIDCHHSGGTLSRCHHFEIADAGAPISADIASRAPTCVPQELQALSCQRSITARNESSKVRGDMDALVTESSLRQIVLNNKSNVSHDLPRHLFDNLGMAQVKSDKQANDEFIARCVRARQIKFHEQKPVYTFLGVDQPTYAKWESRTPMPHRYIDKFCLITECDFRWLMSGEGEPPSVPEYPRKEPGRGRPRKKHPIAA